MLLLLSCVAIGCVSRPLPPAEVNVDVRVIQFPLAVLAACSLAACVGERLTPDFCETAHPIYITEHDVLADETAKGILRHNLTGRRLCDW